MYKHVYVIISVYTYYQSITKYHDRLRTKSFWSVMRVGFAYGLVTWMASAKPTAPRSPVCNINTIVVIYYHILPCAKAHHECNFDILNFKILARDGQQTIATFDCN